MARCAGPRNRGFQRIIRELEKKRKTAEAEFDSWRFLLEKEEEVKREEEEDEKGKEEDR